MFGLGWQEILVVFLLFLLFFGARRLPEIGAGLGKTVKEIRKIRGGWKAEKEKAKDTQKGDPISDVKEEIEKLPGLKEIKDIKDTADKVRNLTKILK